MPTDWYQWDGENLILDIHVVARASRDEIAGLHGERLKVRITAPPVDGRANAHLLRFLAKYCDIPTRQIELLSGDSGRTKRIRIHQPRRLPPGIRPRVS